MERAAVIRIVLAALLVIPLALVGESMERAALMALLVGAVLLAFLVWDAVLLYRGRGKWAMLAGDAVLLVLLAVSFLPLGSL